jgi:hypothetical protein
LEKINALCVLHFNPAFVYEGGRFFCDVIQIHFGRWTLRALNRKRQLAVVNVITFVTCTRRGVRSFAR